MIEFLLAKDCIIGNAAVFQIAESLRAFTGQIMGPGMFDLILKRIDTRDIGITFIMYGKNNLFFLPYMMKLILKNRLYRDDIKINT